MASDLVDAGIHREAMQPRIEPVGIAEAAKVAPGTNERVLDRVARELAIPEDQPCRRVEPRDGRAGQAGEGVMIAPLAPG